MRVSRSLTIKQLAMVSVITVITVCLFIIVQFFYLAQQRRTDCAQQMEGIAHIVRQPLSEAVFNKDFADVAHRLNSLRAAGILARADIMLPDASPVLHFDFTHGKPIPYWVSRLFELPVKITVPLYAGVPASSAGPLAYLVLQADSWRVYQFILSTLPSMVTTYLLLALVLSVVISWCINRLVIHPLREISNQLNMLAPRAILTHKLTAQPLHHDDEIGILIRGYNRNQLVQETIHDEMSRLTTHYRLTDLPNRALFLALLEQHIQSVTVTSQFTVMVVRIETLQEANGVLTDEQRDQLTLILVEKIRGVLEEMTVLGQLGVSDFILLAKQADNPFKGLRLAQDLLLCVTQPVMLQQMQLRPSVSIGLAQRTEDALTANDLVCRAMSAMVSAHHQGKNQILFFDPELTARAQKRLTQEHDILLGLAENKFVLFLQPQVDMRTGQPVGAEILLRIKQPDGRFCLPDDFIIQAEELGVINELGRWVLKESCCVLADWQARGIDIPLSVNVSAVQLRESTMVEHLQELLAQYHIRPGKFVLEMTETARIGDTEQAITQLRQLQQAGVTVALDDFGMGYANLSYLHQFKSLPISKLKMDRSFVSVLPDDDTMVRIVAAIAGIVHLDVIAEGVETTEQRDWLLARGITIGQGYLYAEALPTVEFDAFLQRSLTVCAD